MDRDISSIWPPSASGPPRLRIAPCRGIGRDLLTGANDTHIATLVERNTRFTMLIKIPRKDTTTVVAALAKHISKLPEELRRSLTWDQGKEMHAHKRFTVATNAQVYFCDPRSPRQRGSNENTNGLLRQYLPRGTDFSRIFRVILTRLLCWLNSTSAKDLGLPTTPADRLQAVVCTDRLNAHPPNADIGSAFHGRSYHEW